MPLTPTNYEAKCDCKDCNKQAVGTLQHLSTKGWNMKAMHNGLPQLITLYSGCKYPLVCPECSIMGRYK